MSTEFPIRPLDENVIIRLQKPDEASPGGILLPKGNECEKTPRQGTVVAAGPGPIIDGKRVPMDFEVGDYIYIDSYHGGTKFKIDDVEYIAIDSYSVMGVKR